MESNTNCPICDNLISCVCTCCGWWYCPDHILKFNEHVKGGCPDFCVVEDCYEHQTQRGSKFCKKHGGEL